MRMKLVAKGPIAPPPVLAEPLQRVSSAIQSWPGVIAATHWHLYRPKDVDGADFYVGEMELGHIHLTGDVHLATSIKLRKTLVANGLAQPFPFAGYDAWVRFSIRTKADADHAEWLFRLAYDLIEGVHEEKLLSACIARQSRKPVLETN